LYEFALIDRKEALFLFVAGEKINFVPLPIILIKTEKKKYFKLNKTMHGTEIILGMIYRNHVLKSNHMANVPRLYTAQVIMAL